MEVIPPTLEVSPPPTSPLLYGPGPPRGILSHCVGYLASYNSLIDRIFLLMLCYTMSLDQYLSSNNHEIRNTIQSYCRDGIMRYSLPLSPPSLKSEL